MSELQKIEEYDSEPVMYCSRCFSLKIKYEEAIDSDCCMECGCPDIAESSIEEWEALYEKRYGHKYAEKSNDPRKSPIFKLSIKELKNKVYNGPWQKITKALYPHFPEWMGRKDSVLLLFDKLIRDKRMDDLKMFLFKNCNNS